MIVAERLGPVTATVATAVDDLVARKAVARMWAGDHSLWSDDPHEVADRLGWLVVPAEMERAVPEIEGAALAAAGDGLQRAVLMGMGGSSLFPEVLRRSTSGKRLEPPMPMSTARRRSSPAAARAAASIRG